MKTKMSVEWKTGRPDCSGSYVVVYGTGYVTELTFTPEYGWNTNYDSNEYAIDDDEVKAWAEPFGKHVIDILRHRGIIKGKEVDNGKRLQCD